LPTGSATPGWSTSGRLPLIAARGSGRRSSGGSWTASPATM